MKKVFLSVAIVSAMFAGEAMAACAANNRLSNATTLTNLLTGNTACVAKAGGGWEAQELHMSGGDLQDYKMGAPSSTNKDPTKVIGRWAVGGNGGNVNVAYTYTGGGTFSYAVHGTGVAGSTHSFCNGTTEVVAMIKVGGGGCSN